jgi:hypothetical protein
MRIYILLDPKILIYLMTPKKFVLFSSLLHLAPLIFPGNESRTAANLALKVRRSNHSAISHPPSRLDLIPELC